MMKMDLISKSNYEESPKNNEFSSSSESIMTRKTHLLRPLLLAIIVLFSSFIAEYASSGVAGGKHDLSLGGASNWQYATLDVCVFCHTPHFANTNQSYSTDPNVIGAAGTLSGELLWNRAVPSRAWNVYTSTTLNHNTAGGPGTLSLLCLSCHDGVGAMNVLINNPGSGIGVPPPPVGVPQNQFGDFALGDPSIGPLNIGGAVCVGDVCAVGGDELRDDHPIGFVYNDALDPGLFPIAGMDARLQSRFELTGNRLECSTCHNPHLTNPGGNMFLVMSNAGSALCLECHNK